MSWAGLHLERDDEIRPVISERAIAGYVQLHLGEGVVLMAPRAKAAELHTVLGDALAAAPEQDGGA